MLPGVQRQRAAASLRSGRLHAAAFGGQHAHRRLVDMRERQPLHAAGQQRDLHAPLGPGGRRVTGAHGAGACPRKRDAAAPAPRIATQPAPQTASPRSGAAATRASRRASPPHERQRHQRQPHPRGIRHQRHQQRAEQPVAGRPRIALLDLRARRSMSGPYWTPDGHAVTQARQPRQLSKCVHEATASARPGPRRPPSSGRCARAANPSPRPTGGRSGTSAGRSRSGRRCRCPRSRARRAHPAVPSRRRGGGAVAVVGRHIGPRPAFRIPAGSSARFTAASGCDQRHAPAPDVDLCPSPRAVRRSSTTCCQRRRLRAAGQSRRPGRPTSPSRRSKPAPTADAAREHEP